MFVRTCTIKKRPLQSITDIRYPCVHTDSLKGVRPLTIADQMTMHILETITREKTAFLEVLKSYQSDTSHPLSDPFSNWYRMILNTVYIAQSNTSLNAHFFHIPTTAFALPITDVKPDPVAQTLEIKMEPPALWSSYPQHCINKPLSTNITDNSLFLVIPSDHQIFFGTFIPDECKKDFQKLLPPKVFLH